MNIMEFALNLIESNPDIVEGNPRAQEMVDIIKSGDSKRGEAYAMNLCRTYNSSKDDGIRMAKRFFGI